jgi:hypothetical protein
MSNPSTPTAASVSGRPAVPPQSRTLGRAEPNTVNPRFNAVHSPAEYVKELARYNEAKDRASYHGNGNYNDSNPDDPDASAQHREHVRSSPSSQLPSPTLANPNGQASQNSVLQTPLNNEFLLAYNSLIPNSEFARVHQQMIQEWWQQQQLAREEAAKLKERFETALAEAIAASSGDAATAKLDLGPSRVEPRTRTTIFEIKDPKPLLRAQEAAPGTPTASHLRWQAPMGKPCKIRSSRPCPTRQPNWPTRPPKYGN